MAPEERPRARARSAVNYLERISDLKSSQELSIASALQELQNALVGLRKKDNVDWSKDKMKMVLESALPLVFRAFGEDATKHKQLISATVEQGLIWNILNARNYPGLPCSSLLL